MIVLMRSPEAISFDCSPLGLKVETLEAREAEKGTFTIYVHNNGVSRNSFICARYKLVSIESLERLCLEAKIPFGDGNVVNTEDVCKATSECVFSAIMSLLMASLDPDTNPNLEVRFFDLDLIMAGLGFEVAK